MTQSNLKVAITGGIGSGKSTVAEIIESLGYRVFSCDKIYSELLSDKNFENSIVTDFGECILTDNKIDRRKLSEIVFADAVARQKLNDLTHPVIMRKALSLMSEERLSFCEVPLLFENKFEKFFDEVIVVLRQREIRVDFVSKRDNITQNEANLRINCQYDYDNEDFAKYYVIRNYGDLTFLRRSVDNILKKILKKI